MKKIQESVLAKLFFVFIIAAALVSGSHELTEDYFEKYPSQVTSGVLVFFLFTLFGTFFMTRKILAPLKSLEKGVREVAAGNLDFLLPIDSQDEFGKIEGAFNHMTAEIRKMVRSKEQLLLDVSHEFRTPLNRINIALDVNADEKASIRQAVAEIESMIAELLETARMDDPRGAIKKSPHDLFLLLQELVGNCEDVHPGVRLFSTVPSLIVDIDAPRLRIALQNLIGNALKYSPKQDHPVEVSLEIKSGKIIVAVKDFGIGISEKDQAEIFEPFYRAGESRDRETGGYGLGLSLAKKIVVAHGGVLKVQSEIGKGTTFRLELDRLI
jgi:signal transduction histidine kinase